jgi:hypothetical protein
MSIRSSLTPGLVVSLMVTAAAVASLHAAQGASDPAAHMVLSADQVKYGPLEIPGFTPGLKLAVVHGDPKAESGT